MSLWQKWCEFWRDDTSILLQAIGLQKRKPREREWMVHNEHGVTPLSQTDGGKLFQIVGVKNTCPDCGSKGFYEGPSGGMSTNIFCMNRECRSGFNITHFGSTAGTCDRIGKGDLARYPKQESVH